MVHCKACGLTFKSRERDGETEVYNPNKREWTAECPNCQRYGFNDDDYDDDYYDDDGYDNDGGYGDNSGSYDMV